MDEVRIYYECLEQGYHYIFPIINEVVPASIIKLVKRPKKYSQFENGLYSAPPNTLSLFLFPDILM